MKVLLGRCARLAGHALVAMLCLELAARLDDRLSYGAPFWGRYDAELLRAPDDEGLPRNVPGARFEKWLINSLGFRGDPVEIDKPPGRRRIACLGTSESFGLWEREGGEWPAVLGRLVRDRHHADADVVNASVVNLNRGTRARYIEKYVVPLRPDAVVLYLNVLSDATYRAPPRRSEARPAGVPRMSRAQLPTSRVLPKLRRWARQLVPSSTWRRYRTWSMERAVSRAESAVLNGREPLDVLPQEAVVSFEAHLRELVSRLREHGIAPVLATYPTLGTLANRGRYHLELMDERVWHVELSESGMIDAAARLNDAVRRVARELGVPLADADAALPKDTDFFADYVHYTDAGAALVAETVIKTIEGAGVLGTASDGLTPAAATQDDSRIGFER